MRIALAAALWVVAATASAQTAAPPVESVTVTGARAHAAIQSFVQSFATPSHALDKIARWEDGVCPVAVGLKPAFLNYITARLRDVARQAGAPVNPDTSCAPNIQIVFTTMPQALMDNVRKRQPAFLGYHDNQNQADTLATVTRPIQAWYTTATQDLRGNIQVDSGQVAGAGLDIAYACEPPGGGMCMLHLSNAHAASVTGSRLGDGQRASLYNVIIVAEPMKLLDHEIGALADYITVLALTQIASPDTCQQLPSIVNMLASGCDRRVNALTGTDLAYLRGLYKMSPGHALRAQEDEIAYQMEERSPGR